jgi:hypothetical protein
VNFVSFVVINPAVGCAVALLLNFKQSKLEWKRVVSGRAEEPPKKKDRGFHGFHGWERK